VSETPRPLPGFATWPSFPFEGDLRIKKLDDPVEVEPSRHGDDPSECRTCGAPDEAYIWVSDRWRVRSLERPTGLPMVLILESRSHLDLGDLPNMHAAELGVMTVRLERAIRSLDGVARVHVNRWGDGSAHLHLWFLARPYGQLQLRGTFLSMWDEILPPIPEDRWRENLALVAAWLADFGGRALAEPPRIDWKAPATLAPDAVVAGAQDRAESDPTIDAASAEAGYDSAVTREGGETGTTGAGATQLDEAGKNDETTGNGPAAEERHTPARRDSTDNRDAAAAPA
jgi:hypothetical protein